MTNNSSQIEDQLSRCVRFLADLNGCDWIKGDDAGSVDMRQRAKNLQSTAFDALKNSDIKFVGVVGSMPGTNGFTMSVFEASSVPSGTKLYSIRGTK